MHCPLQKTFCHPIPLCCRSLLFPGHLCLAAGGTFQGCLLGATGPQQVASLTVPVLANPLPPTLVKPPRRKRAGGRRLSFGSEGSCTEQEGGGVPGKMSCF